jgi:hypothetical protein
MFFHWSTKHNFFCLLLKVSPQEFRPFTLRKTFIVAKNMPNKTLIPLDSFQYVTFAMSNSLRHLAINPNLCCFTYSLCLVSTNINHFKCCSYLGYSWNVSMSVWMLHASSMSIAWETDEVATSTCLSWTTKHDRQISKIKDTPQNATRNKTTFKTENTICFTT